jgi:hypothetical protein
MRDTDNENLDENASSTLIIILTWIVTFKNAGKQFSVEL